MSAPGNRSLHDQYTFRIFSSRVAQKISLKIFDPWPQAILYCLLGRTKIIKSPKNSWVILLFLSATLKDVRTLIEENDPETLDALKAIQEFQKENPSSVSTPLASPKKRRRRNEDADAHRAEEATP